MKQQKRVVGETAAPATPTLLDELRLLIEETRRGFATAANATLTLLYWRIGKRINDDILKGARAEYGEAIVSTEPLAKPHF